MVFMAQLAIPVVLLAWMALWPAKSSVGLMVQAIGSLLLLAGIARVGVWLFPPWWVPLAAAIGIVIAAAWYVARRGWAVTRPQTALAWLGLGLFASMALAGVFLLHQSGNATRAPQGPAVVELAFPLAPGRYLVVNGGSTPLMNAHLEALDTSIVRLRAWRGNAHAVDIIAIDELGVRAAGVQPTDPSAYRIFGVPILAPCTGLVVAAVDGLPDMPVPEFDREHMAGNHVVLDCDGVHVVLAHFRRGSVRVTTGYRAGTGAMLGEAGNSGRTNEPHLHIHAQRPGPPDAPFAGDPLPIRLAGRYLVRGDRVTIAEN